MKTLIVFTIVICAIAGDNILDPKIVTEKFQLYQKSFGKSYSNGLEATLRKQIFQKSLEKVQEHNDRFLQGLETYEIGINEFSDRTDSEFRDFAFGIEIPAVLPKALVNISSASELQAKAAAPASLDWRSSGIVNPVKNQASCGCCWAFAAVAAMESHYMKKYGVSSRVSLSEQQLVDCATGAGLGCKGDWISSAYIYAEKNGGLNYDGDYKYEAKDGSCRYSPGKPHLTVTGYVTLTNVNEDLLRDTVASVGPVAVGINVPGSFISYKSGVYYNPNCGTTINHSVVIVGYGRENNQDYWLVRNSWGPSWGLEGYIKMARNRENNCRIASYPTWPIL